MSERKVCFNPELLAGTDVKSEWYRELIQDITPGSFPTAEESCVSEETMCTSFVLSELDPKKFEDVLKYRSARPYYQTVACRMAWGNDVEQSKKWSEPTRRLNEEPLTDEAIRVIREEMGRGCEEFALIEMYHAATDIKLKKEIAERLLSEWDSVRRTMADNSTSWHENIADVHGVYSEMIPDLAQVFHEHFHAAEGNNKVWTARALMEIEGAKAFEYFTNLVLNPETEYNDRWQAADAIFGAARTDHDSIPFVARLLNAEGREARALDQKGAWENVHAGDGGIVADERLLPTVVKKIREGDFDGLEYRLAYMEKIGEASVPYLIGLLDHLPQGYDYFRSTKIFEALAHIGGDAAIQYMSRYILTAKDDHTAKHLLPSVFEAGEAMAESRNPQTQEALLALLDYPMLDEDRLSSLVQSLRYFKTADGFPGIQKVVAKLVAIAGKPDQKWEIASFAKSSIKEHMEGEYRHGFELYFTDFSEAEQLFLLDMVEPKIDEVARYVFREGVWKNYGNEKLTSAVRAAFDERFLDAFKAAVESGRMLNYDSYLSEPLLNNLNDQIWTIMSQGMVSIATYFSMVDDNNASRALRMKALAIVGQSMQSGMDEGLLNDYVLNSEAPKWLREAALEQLGIRAKTPAFSATARAALQKITPIPQSIQNRAGMLFRESR